jgi:hypothetical protein
MGFYPGNFPVQVNLTQGVKLGGVAVTSSAAELNLSDKETQTIAADGAITIKNGVCVISKTVPGVVAATLADPVDVTDNFKRLTIINGTAHASTVTSASSFGGGGNGRGCGDVQRRRWRHAEPAGLWRQVVHHRRASMHYRLSGRETNRLWLILLQPVTLKLT